MKQNKQVVIPLATFRSLLQGHPQKNLIYKQLPLNSSLPGILVSLLARRAYQDGASQK
jgi:hypothetical protein